jgi:ribosomal protein S18 acetylase RimI-like enzyme
MSAHAPTVPVIRRALASDLPRLGRLGALLVQAHHELDPQRFLAGNDRTAEDYASFLSTKLEEPVAAILVAECHAEVIGYTYAAIQGYDYLSLRGPAAVLHDLIVDPAHRGRGVGGLLLNATLAHLKARGAPRVVLWTAEGNQEAPRLFARRSFRRTMVEMTRELEGEESVRDSL